jgi:SH3 domain-containing protein
MRPSVVLPPRRCHLLLALLSGVLAACAPSAPDVAPRPKKAGGTSQSAAVARDTLLEQRLARLELKLLERDAQVADLQARLSEARQEVVRALAKLQTVASRAEAASALAEAEIALQALRAKASPQPGPDLAQATELLHQGTAEFGKQNYGGALYLANQAKSVAGVGEGRLDDPARTPLRPGETPFAVPLKLQTLARANVREGPGAGFTVLFTLDAGTPLVAYSALEQWVRVADEGGGRGGWVHLSVIGRRPEGGR